MGEIDECQIDVRCPKLRAVTRPLERTSCWSFQPKIALVSSVSMYSRISMIFPSVSFSTMQ